MSTTKPTVVSTDILQVDESSLFSRIAEIIETRKTRAAAYANSEVTLMYWEIGRYINSVLLGGERAEYGKRIVSTLSTQLVERYGKSFGFDNIRRMMRFAEKFPDFAIVAPLAPQLSWSHFIEILRLNDESARLYYAKEAAERRFSRNELRRQISRKAYERQEIANAALTVELAIPFNVFKDPYLLDTLGLKDNYLEADLEKAILTEKKPHLHLIFNEQNNLIFLTKTTLVANVLQNILTLFPYSRHRNKVIRLVSCASPWLLRLFCQKKQGKNKVALPFYHTK
jgi:hypothetical protein